MSDSAEEDIQVHSAVCKNEQIMQGPQLGPMIQAVEMGRLKYYTLY